MLEARPDIAARLVDLYGDAGRAWIAELPALVARVAGEWNLDLEEMLWGNYSVVIPGRDTEGRDSALKLAPPQANLSREIVTLKSFDGQGAAKIYRHDPNLAAFLMERITPGTELTAWVREGRDVEATSVACEIMRRLPKIAPDSEARTILPAAADRAAELGNLRKRFDGKTGPFPVDIVEAAESMFGELVASQGDQVIIHGDLHHENILSATREPWLAIDPHGLIAEPEFETYSLLLNPDGVHTWPDLGAVSRRRIDQMSNLLGYDKDRIRGWGLACAVLSAWWSFEGHGHGYEPALQLASVLTDC